MSSAKIPEAFVSVRIFVVLSTEENVAVICVESEFNPVTVSPD